MVTVHQDAAKQLSATLAEVLSNVSWTLPTPKWADATRCSRSASDSTTSWANANQNSTGGFLELRGQEWLVRNIGRIEEVEELADSVVAYRDGTADGL